MILIKAPFSVRLDRFEVELAVNINGILYVMTRLKSFILN